MIDHKSLPRVRYVCTRAGLCGDWPKARGLGFFLASPELALALALWLPLVRQCSAGCGIAMDRALPEPVCVPFLSA